MTINKELQPQRGTGPTPSVPEGPEADEAEREWDPAGHAAKRAEALAANPDNAEHEAERLLREPPELSRG